MKKNAKNAEPGKISEIINNGELVGIEKALANCKLELERMKKALDIDSENSGCPDNSGK